MEYCYIVMKRIIYLIYRQQDGNERILNTGDTKEDAKIPKQTSQPNPQMETNTLKQSSQGTNDIPPKVVQLAIPSPRSFVRFDFYDYDFLAAGGRQCES